PGFGPAATGGTGDSVIVRNASVTSLTVTQGASPPFGAPPGAGASNSITIDTLRVDPNGWVTTAQGGGELTSVASSGVTTATIRSPILFTPSIVVTQGRGSGDRASVAKSNVPGSISITQSDVAGNPLGNTATISGVTVGYTVTSDSGVLQAI